MATTRSPFLLRHKRNLHQGPPPTLPETSRSHPLQRHQHPSFIARCRVLRFGARLLLRCKLPLQGVRFGAGVLVLLQSAAAKCCFRVLLLEWCVRFGASKDCLHLRNFCCQSAVCAMGCLWQCGSWGAMEITFIYAVASERLVATKKYLLLSGVYAGVIFVLSRSYLSAIHPALACCASLAWTVTQH